jgi:hypothetical protein
MLQNGWNNTFYSNMKNKPHGQFKYTKVLKNYSNMLCIIYNLVCTQILCSKAIWKHRTKTVELITDRSRMESMCDLYLYTSSNFPPAFFYFCTHHRIVRKNDSHYCVECQETSAIPKTQRFNMPKKLQQLRCWVLRQKGKWQWHRRCNEDTMNIVESSIFQEVLRAKKERIWGSYRSTFQGNCHRHGNTERIVTRQTTTSRN